MTKKQARLLEDVLHNAITRSNINVNFPASLSEMIDARIAFNERMVRIHKICEDSYLHNLKREILHLHELKQVIEGV